MFETQIKPNLRATKCFFLLYCNMSGKLYLAVFHIYVLDSVKDRCKQSGSSYVKGTPLKSGRVTQ